MQDKEKRTEFVNKVLALNKSLFMFDDSKERLSGVNLITEFFILQKSYMNGDLDPKIAEIRFKNLVNNFIDNIHPDLSNPFAQLAQIYKERQVLGMFTHHRALAECTECKLYEDENNDGYLVTYKGDDFINATDLKFIETEEEDVVICPLCKKKISTYLLD